MIWGCFSKAGIGQICLCEGHMNKATYKVVLEENFLRSSLTMFPNSEDWFFDQDNAPCHTARSIKVWMEDHQIKTLSWPAQSPDLNQVNPGESYDPLLIALVKSTSISVDEGKETG